MPSTDRARRWVAILLAVYAALVMLVAAIPRPIQTGLTPRIRGVLAWLHRHGLRDWIDYEFVEYALHVVVFVPLGILAVVAFGRRLTALAIVIGLGVCAVVEIGSANLSSDPSPSFVDLLLNTAGVLVGAVVGYLAVPTTGRRQAAVAARRSRM